MTGDIRSSRSAKISCERSSMRWTRLAVVADRRSTQSSRFKVLAPRSICSGLVTVSVLISGSER
jgi:hypothetical protein